MDACYFTLLTKFKSIFAAFATILMCPVKFVADLTTRDMGGIEGVMQ